MRTLIVLLQLCGVFQAGWLEPEIIVHLFKRYAEKMVNEGAVLKVNGNELA